MHFKRLVPFLAAFVLPLLAVFAWWGGFSRVEITAGQLRGPYTYAYLESVGDYAKLPERQAEVAKALGAAGVPFGHAITVLFSNPDVVKVGERRARVGYLVPAGSRVAEPLRLDTLPARPVLLARVRAAVLLAPSKAYQALDDYLQARGQGIRMPTVEIYQAAGNPLAMGVLTVEMPE